MDNTQRMIHNKRPLQYHTVHLKIVNPVTDYNRWYGEKLTHVPTSHGWKRINFFNAAGNAKPSTLRLTSLPQTRRRRTRRHWCCKEGPVNATGDDFIKDLSHSISLDSRLRWLGNFPAWASTENSSEEKWAYIHSRSAQSRRHVHCSTSSHGRMGAIWTGMSRLDCNPNKSDKKIHF